MPADNGDDSCGERSTVAQGLCEKQQGKSNTCVPYPIMDHSAPDLLPQTEYIRTVYPDLIQTQD